MLILTRKLKEAIIIGDDIKIVVLGSANGQIRLGISAPKEVAVHREEIKRKIELEQRRMIEEAYA